MYFQVRGLAGMKFPRRLKRVADLVHTVVPVSLTAARSRR